jgi:hypothetical protein
LIAGDAYTGKLYNVSLDAFDEDGAPMPVKIGLPTIQRDRDRVTLYALELYCETGVGVANDPDPQAVMRYSRDGGRLWSNEMARPLGRIGEYANRVIWRPNVQFRALEVEFTLPSKTRRFVLGYHADVR